MKYRFAWLVGLLFIATVLVASPAHAQGAMYDSWPDENGDLYTEVFSTDVEYCPTSYVWSDLVGADGTQYSGANIIQWVTSPPPGTDYTWYFGGTIYAPDPYGFCEAYQWSVTIPLRFSVTYYGAPSQIGNFCAYNSLACASGTPTCPSLSGCAGIEVTEGDECTEYAEGLWVSWNGSCKSCIAIGSNTNGACD